MSIFQITIVTRIHIEKLTSKFDYVLLDFNGNELYRKTFVVQKDHSRVHVIKPKEDMPSGVLVNRFEFSDGSVKSFQTIKN